jgi:small subunit ribosomal protein S16
MGEAAKPQQPFGGLIVVKIRLMRVGAKKNPHYRVVVVDGRSKRSGSYLESLGSYDPRGTTETPLQLDNGRAKYWLEQGAQPTETALKLLERSGVEVGKVEVKRNKGYQAQTTEA